MTNFTFYIILTLIFFRPLGDAFPKIMGDVNMGAIIIGGAAVLALAGILWQGKVKTLVKPPASHLLILILLLVISLILTTHQYSGGFRNIAIVLSSYLIISYMQELMPDRRKMAQVFWMIILSAILPAVLGIMEVLSGGGEVVPGLVPITRAQSTMGDNVFAILSFISFAWAVTFSLLDYRFSKVERFIIIISILLSLISIIIAGYRSSLIATIIFMVFFIYLLSRKTMFSYLAKKLRLGLLVVMIFLAAIIFSWQPYRERLFDLFDPSYYQGSIAASSAVMRLLTLKLVLDQLADAPFGGNGIGSFEVDKIIGSDDAGSMYTLSLYEGGIPLFAAIILIAFSQLTYCYKTLKKVQTANQVVLTAFMGALVISGLMLSLADTFWFGSINGLRYWLALTLGYSCMASQTTDQEIA